MPIGVIVNCCAVLFGGIIGALMNERMPEKLKYSLPIVFGISALTNGVVMAGQLHAFAPIVLALAIGTIIGELLNLNENVITAAKKLNGVIQRGKDITEENLEFFTSMLVLFCASALGIFGAMNEGLTGDHSALLFKAVMDFFTAMIFASSAGIIIALIAVPQAVIFLTLYFQARLIIPLANDAMMANFNACGGIITVACGIQILRLKQIRIINMLPSFIIVMPFTYLWDLLIR